MKNWLKGTNAAVLSLAVVGIFIILTIFLHSLKGVQWDLTASKKFTLSDQTISTLNKLDKDVHVLAFTNPGAGVVDRQIKDLLEEYHKRNGKFTWEEVDPKKQPTVAQKYQVDRYGTIVFESGGKTKNVYSDELFGNGSSEGSYAFSGEEKFTQAILSLSSGEKRHAYAVTGHGELTSAQAADFVRSLDNQGLEVKDLNLLKDASIPQDADVLFVLSPQTDISDKEADLLKTFVKDKGKLYFSLDLAKDMDKRKNWDAILQSVGVIDKKALVIESKKTLMNDPLTIVPEYGSHDITEKLQSQQRIAVLPGAMALGKAEDNKDYIATTLLKTSDQAYGKTNLGLFAPGARITENDLKKTDKDLTGPVDLAYAVTNKENKPKAIVVGNGVFLRDELINEQGNKDFALNSVAWLQEQKDLVTIRPREEAQLQQAVIGRDKANAIFIGTVIVFPLLFLATGGVIWWRRRKG